MASFCSKLINGIRNLVRILSCPIIRIGPNELHINDPSFYKTMFCTNDKFPVHAPSYNWLGTLDTFIGAPPTVHRARRSLVNPFFSKASVRGIEGSIRKHVNNLVNLINPRSKLPGNNCGVKTLRTEAGLNPGDGIDILSLCRRLTSDVMSEYLLGNSFELLTSDKHLPFLRQILDTASNFQHYQFAGPIIYALSLPPIEFLAKIVLPREFRGYWELGPILGDHADALTRNPTLKVNEKTSRTILEALVEGRPGLKLSKRVIVDESLVIIAGGIETTAVTLAEAFYRVCIHPEVQARLHKELVKEFPNKSDEITLARAEKLQYLTAFLKEILRIAPAVPGRRVGVVPADGAICRDRFFPGGVGIFLYISETSKTY
ncbi:hypothetical protein TWF718_000416 [Orbilia javanica]|uniref:Cytochrome P450 n=1 Tax=Orbilia javanica TaxID=47235 RepID=A0AAN8N7E3_9PEZI